MNFAQYPQFVLLLPQNCRLIVVDAKQRGTSLLYESKVLTLLTRSQCMMYACCCTENTTTVSTRCQCGLGGRTIARNAKKHLITRISTSVNYNTLVECGRKTLSVQTILHKILQIMFWCILQQYLFQQSQKKRGMRSRKIVSNHICESFYCTYCNKEVNNTQS